MNISSLLTGIVIGAAATNMMSKNSQNGSMSQVADKAKGKMMDLAGFGMNLTGDHEIESASMGSTQHSSHGSGVTSGTQTQTHTKESSMNMVKDFIKQNPDVKYEVDMILKETNTVIPGL